MNEYDYIHADPTGSTLSPIYEQVEHLDRRLETTYQEFLTLLQQLSPVLTTQSTDKQVGPPVRDVSCSPLHERLVTLNEKASAFARAVSDTHKRITV